ncbi:MAG: hypothetical protein LBP62_00580 [Clostridiales bacterium]|jgi:hypothetical protein|nr:hypothetical protein [Clostridiales bacterium]
MGSWRDSASKTTQKELDGLFDFQLKAAVSLLQKNKEFYPIAASAAGKDVSPVAFYDGNEYPESLAVIDGLKKALKAQKHTINAAAIAFDVLVSQNGKKSNAVCVDLEHKDGICFRLVTPYEFGGLFKKRVTLGKTQMQKCEKFIWR